MCLLTYCLQGGHYAIMDTIINTGIVRAWQCLGKKNYFQKKIVFVVRSRYFHEVRRPLSSYTIINRQVVFMDKINNGLYLYSTLCCSFAIHTHAGSHCASICSTICISQFSGTGDLLVRWTARTPEPESPKALVLCLVDPSPILEQWDVNKTLPWFIISSWHWQALGSSWQHAHK